jgi:hypothetical protein
MTEQFPISQGELHFRMDQNGQFFCQELQKLPERFLDHWGEQKITQAIEEHIENLSDCFILLKNKELSEEENKTKAKKIFKEVCQQLQEELSQKQMSPFEQFLFWHGQWWYFNKTCNILLKRTDQWEIYIINSKNIEKYVLPVLPKQILSTLENSKLVNSCANFGHFAFMFDGVDDTRHIITDTQLFELRDVSGYVYLDIMPDGKPVARSRTSEGGRAFFDGIHLMAHHQFRTCAPSTQPIIGGYKVNSTRVTIINGKLFPLLEIDDKISHSTGCNCPFDFVDRKEMMKSKDVAKETAKRLRIENDNILYNDEILEPLGEFQPCNTELLESGFTLCGYSNFYEHDRFIFKSALVVDDSSAWVEEVKQAFDNDIPQLDTLITNNKVEALEQIKNSQAEVILLDMHLTATEEFDGLWIINQLAEKNFEKTILLCSSYPEEQLKAMRQLIKIPVGIPGKDISKVKSHLLGKIRID